MTHEQALKRFKQLSGQKLTSPEIHQARIKDIAKSQARRRVLYPNILDIVNYANSRIKEV